MKSLHEYSKHIKDAVVSYPRAKKFFRPFIFPNFVPTINISYHSIRKFRHFGHMYFAKKSTHGQFNAFKNFQCIYVSYILNYPRETKCGIFTIHVYQILYLSYFIQLNEYLLSTFYSSTNNSNLRIF
jgi:hypothetical protein